jgi:hypothetical protein
MAVAVTFCYNHETSEVIIARPDRTLATEPGDFLERSTVRRFASRYPEETDGSVQRGRGGMVRFLAQLRFTHECSIIAILSLAPNPVGGRVVSGRHCH